MTTANEWKMNQLDFRFADDEDAEDIKTLINTVYVHEEEDQGDGGFRPVGDPKIGLSELIDDMESSSVRWLLLETPRPEEAVIAALRMHVKRVEDGAQHSVVDLFGSLEPPEQCSVRNMLLNRAETVCRSLGCRKIVFEIPNWSEDRQRWIGSCGYSDLGGHAWPDDKQDEVTRYTMVLEYEKSLVDPDAIQNLASSLPPTRSFPPPPIPSDLLGGVIEDEIIDVDYNNVPVTTSGCDNGSDPMFPIISDLFVALHAEARDNTTQSSVNSAISVVASEGSEQLELEGATVEVMHAGGSFKAESGLSDLLSSLTLSLPPDAASSVRGTVEQTTTQHDPMTNLIDDLFSALHSEAGNVSANNSSESTGSGAI